MDVQIYLTPILIIFLFMCYVFILAQIFKNNSIVDIFWSLGFIILVVYFSFTANKYIEAQNVLLAKHVVNLCVMIWGFRLAIHIYLKNRNQPEDWRYVNFRKLWKKKNIPQWLGAFFQVFMLQGFFMFLISLSLIHVNNSFQGISLLTFIGLLLWLIGFIFEALGDYQKNVFKKNPANKGKILNTGLWKYTRHPNYFGESVMWWAIWMMSINFFQPVYAVIGLISPIVLTWLLTRVSGVPMLESKYKDNEAYQQYIKTTPSFFPRFR